SIGDFENTSQIITVGPTRRTNFRIHASAPFGRYRFIAPHGHVSVVQQDRGWNAFARADIVIDNARKRGVSRPLHPLSRLLRGGKPMGQVRALAPPACQCARKPPMYAQHWDTNK